MKVKRIDDRGGELTLEVLATASEVNREFDKAQLAFIHSMSVRPSAGQSIQDAAKEKLGIRDLDAMVEAQVTDRLVPYALDKLNIAPAIMPKAEYSVTPKRGRAHSFTVYVVSKPEFELDSYAPVDVEVDAFTFDESAAEEIISKRLERFIEFVEEPARPVEAHDNCFISMSAKVEGVAESRLSTDGRVYSIGKGFMPAAFDEALIGMECGQTKTIEFNAPRMGNPEGSNDVRYECEVTLLGLRRKTIPALADGWVAENIEGCSTVEEFRKKTYEESREQQRALYDQRLREKVIAEFSKGFNFEVPQELFDQTYNAVLDNLKATVRLQGKDFLEYVKEQGGEEQVDIAVSERARQSLAQDLSLDALFRHEGLSIEEVDYLAAAADIDPLDPVGMRKALEGSGKGFVLREVAARHAAARWLVDHSTINIRSDEH